MPDRSETAPVKAPAHVAEQLRLEQVLGDRGAVDRGERAGTARAHAMDRARHHFLAGAALTCQQHRRVVCRYPLGQLQQRAQGRAFGHQDVTHRVGAQRRTQLLHLAAEALALLGLPQGERHFVGPERLVEIVVGTLAHGGDGDVFAAVRAHHHHEGRAPLRAIPAQEGEPVHLRHAHVAQHEVELLVQRPREPLLRVALRRDLVARLREEQAQGLSESGVVVDDEQAHQASPASGRKILNTAPPSRARSTQTMPPRSCTVRATMASPRPVPAPGALVV